MANGTDSSMKNGTMSVASFWRYVVIGGFAVIVLLVGWSRTVEISKAAIDATQTSEIRHNASQIRSVQKELDRINDKLDILLDRSVRNTKGK